MSADRPEVLLLLPNARERALLMAELQEQGVDVAAERNVSAGLRRVLLEKLSPRVVVWDVSLGHPTSNEAALLREFAPDAQMVVLARPSVEVEKARWPRGTTFVERPVSIGALADMVRQLLK